MKLTQYRFLIFLACFALLSACSTLAEQSAESPTSAMIEGPNSADVGYPPLRPTPFPFPTPQLPIQQVGNQGAGNQDSAEAAYPFVEPTIDPNPAPADYTIKAFSEALNISMEDAKYTLEITNPMLSSGLLEALATQYPDTYAGHWVFNPGKNQYVALFFTKDEDGKNAMKEVKQYIKEEWLKHVKIRQATYSLKELEQALDEIIVFIAQFTPDLGEAGFVPQPMTNYEKNRVDLLVTDPERFRLFLKERNIEFPKSVFIMKGGPFRRIGEK